MKKVVMAAIMIFLTQAQALDEFEVECDRSLVSDEFAYAMETGFINPTAEVMSWNEQMFIEAAPFGLLKGEYVGDEGARFLRNFDINNKMANALMAITNEAYFKCLYWAVEQGYCKIIDKQTKEQGGE